MAGVRITSNRIVVLDEPAGDEKLRVSTIRLAVIHSVTEQNPDFPAGLHMVQLTS